MKLQFIPKSIFIKNPELLDIDKSEVIVAPAQDEGKYSHELSISIQQSDKDVDAYCTIWINKNEAQYLAKLLMAFANEKKIDTDAVD